MADFTSPGETGGLSGPRVVVLLGDSETAEAGGMLGHAADAHGVAVASSHFFAPGAVDDAGSAVAVPSVVEALVTAARNGWGLWLPYPQDLGPAAECISIVGVAASLGIPLYVSPHVLVWQSQVLPGIGTTNVVAAIGTALRSFLAAVHGELLVAELATSLTSAEEAA